MKIFNKKLFLIFIRVTFVHVTCIAISVFSVTALTFSVCPTPLCRPVTEKSSSISCKKKNSSKASLDIYFAPTCQHCMDFFDKDFSKIYDNYIKTGKLTVSFYILPMTITDNGIFLDAIIAKICHKEGDFFENLKFFTKHQNEWNKGNSIKDLKGNIRKFLENKGSIKGIDVDKEFKNIDYKIQDELIDNAEKIAINNEIEAPAIFLKKSDGKSHKINPNELLNHLKKNL